MSHASVPASECDVERPPGKREELCRYLIVSLAPRDHEGRDLVIDIAIGFPDEFLEALPGLDCPEGQL